MASAYNTYLKNFTGSGKIALKALCCFTVLFLLLVQLAAAQIIETPKSAILSGTQIIDQAIATVEYEAAPGEQNIKINNIITLFIDETKTKYIPADFTVSLNIKIEYGNDAGNLQQTNQTLTINYKKAEGQKFNAKQHFAFEGAKYVRVTVLNPSVPVIGGVDIREVLTLENELRFSRYFSLQPGILPAGFQQNTSTTTADELGINWNEWNVTTGVTHTQVEWAWLENELEDEYANGIGGIDDVKLFASNSSRVDLPASIINYSIPILYDGAGKLYCRIRGVNIREDGTRTDGSWSTTVIYNFGGHEANLNWQATTSFAEEGKRKTVIEYFDGTLRPRQTVTKDNVTKTTVTAETIYDGQGRPAVQILPTPGIAGIIKYHKDLNLFNGQSVGSDPVAFFDFAPANPAAMSTSTGAAQYYSAANPNAGTDENKNLPDAEGYPYTVTRYTPDATGRILSQSGVGQSHRMGSNHETKYYYSSPAQEELDGLFGTEVGNSTHYFKTMVRDANGQMSVSYTDMYGRTIATALAGTPPASLQPLPSSGLSNSIMRNLVQPGINIRRGNSVESINNLSVAAQGLYKFTYAISPYAWGEALCKDENGLPIPVCYDCLYDLEISITDESGDTEPQVWKFSNVSLTDFDCGTPAESLLFVSATPGAVAPIMNGGIIKINTNLEPGTYSVRKTLTVSEKYLDYYKQEYLNSYLSCNSKQALIDSVTTVMLGGSNCGNPPDNAASCTECMQQLGETQDVYRSNYLTSIGKNPAVTQEPELEAAIKTAYKEAKDNCDLLCTNTTRTLENIRAMMLQDMVPYEGQYAKNPADNVPGGDMYIKYDVMYDRMSSPFFKNPLNETNGFAFYLDDNGNKDQTLYPLDNPGLLYALPADEFKNLFKYKWAEQLLPYHPEYQKLKFAEDVLKPGNIYAWIDDFNATNTYNEAVTKNYILLYGNTTAAPYNDPIYSIAPPGFYLSKILQKITQNYYGANSYSMWQLAYIEIKCKNMTPAQIQAYMSGVSPVLPQPPYTNFSDPQKNLTPEENDRLWRIYRGFYANERRKDVNKYIQDMRPQNDNMNLIAENYVLHFYDNDFQIALQGGQSPNGNTPLTWFTGDVNQPPAGVNLDPVVNAQNIYTLRCESYIQQWRAALLQCPQLEAHPQKEAILTAITNGMKQVCINGSNAANPYGSSNVPASFTGPGPRSFEEVITAVFDQYNAANPNNLILRTNLCNPFVIEWPKPHGKGPRMFGEITAIVDSCACANFATISAQAIAENYNPLDLTSINQFLQLKYQETLTPVMHAALLNCSSYTKLICTPRTRTVTTSVYDTDPCNSCYLPTSAVKNSDSTSAPSANAPGCLSFAGEPSSCQEFQEFFNYFFDMYPNAYANGTCTQDFVDLYNTTFFGSSTWLYVTYGDISFRYSLYCGYLFPDICSTNTQTVQCPDGEDCSYKFIPFNLPSPQPLPEFLKCGYSGNYRCVDCKTLSQYTAEFKQLFSSTYNQAPVFNSTSLTDEQLASNILYAKFLNYRTGFQYNWMVYAKAANDATCNLANYAANTNAVQNVICGNAAYVTDINDIITPVDPCDVVRDKALALANQIWETRIQNLMANFEANYKSYCLTTGNTESFTVEYESKEHHYTLYYYDQAGNLVKTVPPAGVQPNYTPSFLNNVKTARANNQYLGITHQLVTQYRYNSLNQVITQNSPDGGTSYFWYDELGRLVVSQNAKQQQNNQYSYTLYDDLGRIIEVGQKPQATLMTQTISQNKTSLLDWIQNQGGIKEQLTLTGYDERNTVATTAGFDQKNLRNRVSFTATKNKANDANYYSATYYTYDIHGNVDVLVQDYKGIIDAVGSNTGDQFKRIEYNYDLISGKVNMVSYQPDYYNTALNTWIKTNDKFFHKYSYDAENRLIEVRTSRDKIVWERDAAYNYYKHGPLARTTLGQMQVQGVDYAYTLHGWLKGVNSTAISPTAPQGTCQPGTAVNVLDVNDRQQYGVPYQYVARQEINFIPEFFSYTPDEFETEINPALPPCIPNNGASAYVAGDIGEDGKPGSPNVLVARDVFGFALHYYHEGLNMDYKPINGASVFATPGSTGSFTSLYNGNIGAMSVNISGLQKNSPAGGTLSEPLFYSYRYDQLNRIVSMQAYKGFNASTNQWSPVSINDYREDVTYDPNGNILTYNRKGAPTTGKPEAMDQLTYSYLPNSNKLRHVKDAIGNANYEADIDNQPDDNYLYDAIGNLIRDEKENIQEIKWTVYGKIESIKKYGGAMIEYTYDAAGNRISKKANGITTMYVRDASGNVMSVYEAAGAILQQKEVHLYGSSRLGMVLEQTVANTQVTLSGGFGTATITTFIRGNKLFELSNHLGNVLTTITDRKIAIDADNNGTIDYYYAEVASAQDYYPFGMAMPGRSFNGGYRYGFNGKEEDKETISTTTYDYGFRIYNPALGKFLSVDPLVGSYPFYSPYHFAGNNPIENIDLDGAEPKSFIREYKPVSVFILNTRKEVGSELSIYDTELNPITAQAIFDKTTNQLYFIFKDAAGQWFYLKNDDGNDQVMHLKPFRGGPNQIITQGKFVPYKTYDEIHGDLMINLAEKTATAVFGIAAGSALIAALPGTLSALTTYASQGLINMQTLSWGGHFLKEAGKKIVAARGDLSKVDWFDVTTSTIASKFKVGLLGKSLTELINAGVDIQVDSDGIHASSIGGVVGDQKNGGLIILDITFSHFKLVFGELAKAANASKPSDETLKMMFDQIKTQIKEAIKNRKEE